MLLFTGAPLQKTKHGNIKTYASNPHFSQILKNRRASTMMFSIQPSSWMSGIIMNIEFHPIIYAANA